MTPANVNYLMSFFVEAIKQRDAMGRESWLERPVPAPEHQDDGTIDPDLGDAVDSSCS